jgi:K+-transporting ATPase ATPase A chain
MTWTGWAEFALLLALVVASAPFLAAYMARVFAGERTALSPVLAPVERGFYAAAGVDPGKGQDWRRYLIAMLAFNAAGFVLLYAILRLQNVLPMNPAGLPAR